MFILKHNTSIMESLKSIIDKNFGNIPKAFWATFSAYLTEAYTTHNNSLNGVSTIPVYCVLGRNID